MLTNHEDRSTGQSPIDAHSDKSLATDEQILYRAQLSPAYLATGPLVLAALSLFIFPRVPAVSIFMLLFCVVSGIVRYFTFRSADFALTNRRLLAKQGIIRRRSLELFLSQLESVAINQWFLGRLFGWGALVVSGTGGTRESFTGISRSLEFRKKIQDQVVIARQEDRR